MPISFILFLFLSICCMIFVPISRWNHLQILQVWPCSPLYLTQLSDVNFENSIHSHSCCCVYKCDTFSLNSCLTHYLFLPCGILTNSLWKEVTVSILFLGFKWKADYTEAKRSKCMSLVIYSMFNVYHCCYFCTFYYWNLVLLIRK